MPLCQLLRNHCTIQKIAYVQYGNVSQSTTKITSAATLVQYFRLRHHHGNKSRTAWFIFRNTRRSSVVAVRFRYPVERSPQHAEHVFSVCLGSWSEHESSPTTRQAETVTDTDSQNQQYAAPTPKPTPKQLGADINPPLDYVSDWRVFRMLDSL